MKLYLDTDVLLAVIKDDDRFGAVAEKFLTKQNRENLCTSTTAILEVLFFLYNKNRSGDAPATINDIETMVGEIIPLEINTLRRATQLATVYSLSPADSIHAAYALEADGIVSSDGAFDRVANLKKIDFTKA